jgi:hypothetical protein
VRKFLTRSSCILVSLATVIGTSISAYAQEVVPVRIFWDISAPPGALYLNICSDPGINGSPNGTCAKINVLNSNVTSNKDKIRLVDDRLRSGKRYRACIIADQTQGRSGRWYSCSDFTASPPQSGEAQTIQLSSASLRSLRPNP